MTYKVENSLKCFGAWSGGKDTLDVLIEKGDCEEVEAIIDSLYADGEIPTETAINDLLWFERDWIAQELGYADWDAYEYGEEEEEEETEEEEED